MQLRRLGTRSRTTAIAGAVAAAIAFTPVPATARAAADDYPFRDDVSGAVDPWTFTKRECVSFAAWRLSQRGQAVLVRGWGSARDWDDRARHSAVRVSRTPRVGAIAQWNSGERSPTFTGSAKRSSGSVVAGPTGHVGVVRSVHRDGSATVEQYNLGGRSYSVMRTRAPRYLYVGIR